MQQAGMHAAEPDLASGRQPHASLQSGILDNQPQPQQQQQSVRADSSVLEWCSRADELLQVSAAPGEAAAMQAMQAALPGSLQTGLTVLPAYSGAAVPLGPLTVHSQALVLRMILVVTVRTDLMVMVLLAQGW